MPAVHHSDGTSTDEFVERLKNLIAAHVVESNRLLARFGHFVQEASRALGSGSARERMDTKAILSRWLDFNLASYAVTTNSSLSMLNGLIAAAESTLIPKPVTPCPTGPAAPRVELSAAGRRGEQAIARFELQNQLETSITVHCECDDLIPGSGQAQPGACVRFEPTEVFIPAKGTAVVQAIVSITPEFTVGEVYKATIQLRGCENKVLGLAVTVLPDGADDKPDSVDDQPVAKKAVPKAKRSTKKRRARK
jgi:hypothetical protein